MKKVISIISAPPQEPPLEAGDTTDDAEPVEAAEIRAFTIGTSEHRQRLDRALATLVPEFSRSYVQQLIEAGGVRLQGRVVTKPSTVVAAGAGGSIELRPTAQSQAFRPEPMPLQILFQDDHLQIVDKPAGLVVHPAPGHWSGTLLNGLLAQDRQAAQLPRAGIVHRLDRDTSGLMVVARSRAAMDALVAMIGARQVTRQYLAIAHGPWRHAESRTIEAPIGRDPRNRLRMAVVDLARHPGKPARTHVQCLDSHADACLLRCTLDTGRTHQIRVHMAALGHPLVGDVLYGGTPAAGLSRQALHAFRLAFVHPMTQQALEFGSTPAPDLAAALAHWGLHYNRG